MGIKQRIQRATTLVELVGLMALAESVPVATYRKCQRAAEKRRKELTNYKATT